MVEASSTLECASLLTFAGSAYPSGRDHQDFHPHALAAASTCDLGGSGGNGGSVTWEAGVSSTSCGCSGFGFGASSRRPSEDTFTWVMEAGMASPLLDLRLVRNFLGDSSLGFFASSLGSSPVAPPLTPMLSFAVWTMAGAFDRQLPVPESHLLPRGVCVPEAVGVVAPTEDVDAATDWSEGASGRMSLLLGVVSVVLASCGTAGALVDASEGASGFGFDFLRGFIPAGRVKELRRRCDRWSKHQHGQDT